MKKRKGDLTQPAVSLPGKTKVGVPPEHSGTAIDVQPQLNRKADRFPVVGIGASAGGLAAFEAFFSGMPADSDPGMAFVMVQHLAPDHKSVLAELIRRYTRMEVFKVEDGMKVKINCVYVIPPNRDMTFKNGKLQLLEPLALRGRRLPIDFFFRSLAQDQHERAIGVVLSGTGSDGTLGVRAIKDEGGMVMAQNPESAEYDGMPRSAIATGMVDFELTPAEMPVQLIIYTSMPLASRPPRHCPAPPRYRFGKSKLLKKEMATEIQKKIGNWQEAVDVTADIMDIPAGLIMRLDDPYIEVFVSSRSEGNPYHPGDKEKVWGSGLYCETVIKTKDKLLVPNALKDDNWKNNPDIKLNMVSYLGHPILLPDGRPFGTICVLDNKENSYSIRFEKLLLSFRNLIQSDLEIIYMNKDLGDENKCLNDYISKIQTLRGILPICMHCKKIKDDTGYWQQIEKYIHEHLDAQFSHGICQECAKKHYPDFDIYED